LEVLMRHIAQSVALLCGATAASAEMVEHQTNLALDAFYWLCLNDEFTVERAMRLATDLDWLEVTDDYSQQFQPEASQGPFGAWIISHPDEIRSSFLLAAGRSVGTEEAHTELCSTYFYEVRHAEFTEGFKADTSAQIVQSDARGRLARSTYTVEDFPLALVHLQHPRRREHGLLATVVWMR
jgi:hypothetical protein